MFRLAHDIGAVINAVEVDPLAEIVLPRAVRGRGNAGHRGGRGPHVHVRHHFVVPHTGRNVPRPPHNPRDAESAFERRAFFAAERHRAGVRPCILPRAIVGGDDDDGVGSLCANRIHDLANVGIEFEHGIGIVTEVGLTLELLGRNVGVVQSS